MTKYTLGHHESVLRSHRWRTAANSAAYLLPHLPDGAAVLDVGCGPGTITQELADLVGPTGSVLGIDNAAEVIELARAESARSRHGNLRYEVRDVMGLDLPDDSFDVVHAHQVLQHLTDPIAALREMARVTRPGGLVVVRDADYAAMTWHPSSPAMDDWPGWAVRMREARQMLETFKKNRDTGELPPAEPKPQPLAIVPSGLAIADVVAKLTELQQQFPGAELRRGRANQWELWNPVA